MAPCPKRTHNLKRWQRIPAEAPREHTAGVRRVSYCSPAKQKMNTLNMHSPITAIALQQELGQHRMLKKFCKKNTDFITFHSFPLLKPYIVLLDIH